MVVTADNYEPMLPGGKRIATNHRGEAKRFIHCNFYVEDGLASLANAQVSEKTHRPH